MIAAAVAAEMDPLASRRLFERLPQLRAAMDADNMAPVLEESLLRDHKTGVVACGRPRAELDGAVCSLQYPVAVRSDSGEDVSMLVLGAVFDSPDRAAALERDTLSPLAERLNGAAHAHASCTAVIPQLNLACSVFPVSAALPQLVELLQPDALTTLVRAMAGGCSIRVRSVERVAFRRTRGCVLRLHVEGGSDAVLYAKVGYAAYGDAAVNALSALASSAVARELELPRVLGRDDRLETTVLAEMRGRRADLSSEAGLIVDAAARAAALVHASGVHAPVRSLREQTERAMAATRQAGEYAPELARWLLDALESAQPREGAFEPMPVFSHGDLTPSQLLFDGPRAGLLDFDKCCSAEAALDLGQFLAYLKLGLSKRGASRIDELPARFLQAYEAAGGTCPPAARIRAYEMAALVRIAARSWLQLKPQRLRVACEVIERELSRSRPA